MTDMIDYEEVFGVEAPETEETEAVTEETLEMEPPAGEASAQESEGEQPEESTEGQEQPEEAGEPESTAQLAGEDGGYEAVRRRAQEEARESTARELDGLIAGSGLTDPYTEKPITNLAELRAYRERYEQEKRREFQESHGMDDRAYREFVEELPEVKEARAAAQRMQAREIQSRIEGELREIARLDPTVKGLPDLAQRPEYGSISALVERGYSLSDAWKLTNFDALSQRAAEAARQETRNALGGKRHLSATSTRGEGAEPVPTEVAEEYRQLVPDATDAEIQRHYDSYVKKTK